MSTNDPGAALAGFHPLIGRWFLTAVGRPTEVQEQAWPLIARGEHVLVTAPTGTGKTLAAFLWGINSLVTGALQPGRVRILYVSPLKALNNDIQRNLLGPLDAIAAAFRAAGAAMPRIRVLTRSGDTPASDRRRMLREPPEILITTPESLNLILSSANGRLMLDGVSQVILDEIHAVADSKRGAHLMSGVDRLVRIAGDFQRIALSATVRPLSVIADFVGGSVLERGGPDPVYRRRQVRVVSCPLSKVYDLHVSFPVVGVAEEERGDEPVFDAIARQCRLIIERNRSTLFFVNSRRHAEKLARFINDGLPEPVAWAHHGSLSRELRLVVEQRLKAGELKAIVATSSLELGIDIGALDEVVLVQTPFTAASTVQRLGRAGHGVGEVSRGVLFPLHGKDIVDAAVMARCVREQDIAEIAPVSCPLDVLAQVLVSMTAVETWKVDDLFDTVRAGSTFHALSRRQFDLVLDMLAGRYEETRLRDLSAMLSYDRLEGTVRAREGARIRLVTNGGTIPDRGSYALRTADSKALIGELDEEFVWERSPGDSFVFGTQGWRIQSIDARSVEVVPVAPRIGMSPFWKAEERNRSFHLSDRIAQRLEEWNPMVGTPELTAALEKEGLDPDAADAAAGFLERQREWTGGDLPHRHHVLVEHTRDPDGKTQGATIIMHTMWGGKVNRPFGLALSAAWEERFGYAPEMIQNNDALMLLLPEEVRAQTLFSLVESGGVERLLRKKLEGSGFFGARFRESAGRALLLPRATARGRTPLWLTRQRAKSLYAAVARYDDFPMLLEAWRTCLQDEFDLPRLALLLDDVANGRIRVTEASTASPSPLCGQLVWKQTNTLMYADDTPPGPGGTSLRPDLVRELALSPDLRPRIAAGTVALFVAKLQRTAEGYAPRDAGELVDWVKERVCMPVSEWDALLAACARDYGLDAAALQEEAGAKVCRHSFGGETIVTAVETLPRLRRAQESPGTETAGAAGQRAPDPLGQVVAEWLRFYGPVDPAVIGSVFSVPAERTASLLEELAGEELVVLDRLIAGTEDLAVCDRENLERLLRLSRAQARPEVRTRDASELPLFAARRHGLVARADGEEGLKRALDLLIGAPVLAHAWEEDVLPARLSGYRSRWLDGLVTESGLQWMGCGRQRLTFCFPQDTELFIDREGQEAADAAAALFPDAQGRYSFWDIAEHARGEHGVADSRALAETLWDLAWKGAVANDSFEAVRRGIANGFRAPEPALSGGRRPAAGLRRTVGMRRPGFDRWQAARPTQGLWMRLVADREEKDALDNEEIARDRIRQALQRHGVIFREMLENELPPLRWPRLFRSLRLMEFSGEVVSGRFFHGIRGLQFALPAALEDIASDRGSDEVWWLNAADPASLCGVDVEGLKGLLPPRLPTTHVVFHGSSVALVSRRRGRELELRVPPDAPRMDDYLGFFRILTGREQHPMSAVHVETINGERAGSSAYKGRLVAFGFTEDYRRLTLHASV